MAYNPASGPFYDWGKDPFYSSNTQRFNTGGASPALTGIASGLATDNTGTEFANAMRQAAERNSAAMYRQARDQNLSAGGAGNYGAMAGIQAQGQQNVNGALGSAYAQGAQINQGARKSAGEMFAKADEINQQGNRDSQSFISSLAPKEFGGFVQNKMLDMGINPANGSEIGNEDFGSALMKSLLGGSTLGLAGSIIGGVGSGIGNLIGGKSWGGK
jgi:hypothetical protein